MSRSVSKYSSGETEENGKMSRDNRSLPECYLKGFRSSYCFLPPMMWPSP